jgi:glycine/D-amino acid oxidase-like deaminating enzyme
MDLKSGYPFWPIRNGLMQAFPRLEKDLRCDVLVVGGGITGALIARELADADLDVVVVDERDIAWGSTAASTALLQYEIDTHLVDLAKEYGRDAAERAYLACRDAVLDLEIISREVGDVDYLKVRSLYVATRRRDFTRLRAEYAARKRIKLDVAWVSAASLQGRSYRARGYGAIKSETAGCIDPYRFTSRLLKRLQKRGVRIFDRTRIDSWQVASRGIVARIEHGAAIRSSYLVVAAGYASQKYVRQRMARNRSTYAFVTDPLPAACAGDWQRSLLWESARPYLYMRPTSDGRLMVGGEDDRVDVPARRDRRLAKKVRTLQKRLAERLPEMKVEPAFAWAGTFAETNDGLPYFGSAPKSDPRVLFAMAYGGNGITYSVLGARILREAILKRPRSPLGDLFAFDRRR